MAKSVFPADLFMSMLMRRNNFTTLNGITFDPIYRTVTLEVVGSDVPNVEEVQLRLDFKKDQWEWVAKEGAQPTPEKQN